MGFDDKGVEQFREALCGVRFGFFGVEVFERSRYMLRQRKGMETFGYRCLDNFLECVLRMSAELARVAVMRVRHFRVAGTRSIWYSVDV